MQAGQDSSLFPGLGLILNPLSQEGHWMSTLTIFLVNVKIPEQAEQVSSAGLLSVPATNTVMQFGHGTFSLVSISTVG